MGGPASPLLWNMGYDPVLVGLSEALGIECPTYVDDLMALVRGPRQALEAVVRLLAVKLAFLVQQLDFEPASRWGCRGECRGSF